MHFIKKLFEITKRNLLLKYALISFLSYLYTFSLLYLFVEKWNQNRTLSFLLIYGSAYILLYWIHLRVLFLKQHQNKRLLKYIFSILLFYISANLIYNAGLYLKIHYLLSTALTIVLLMPMRFLFLKFFVYKD